MDSRENAGGQTQDMASDFPEPRDEGFDSVPSLPMTSQTQAATGVDPGEQVTLPTDEELVRRLHAGDESALELLVAAYWEKLVRFVEGIVAQEGGGDDVVQEAFIRLWMRREKLKLQGSFRGLLYTLTRNVAIDERRRWTRRRALSAKMDPPPPQPSPAANAEASRLQAVAEAAIDALPPRRREVFRLARTEGLSYKEIAEVMGLSSQTVANQMSKALTSLHQALDGVIGGEALPDE